ncbi:MAG: SDR family oxidoreductase [bacterium]|nr:SDR family oxidoreductase [bacterium]
MKYSLKSMFDISGQVAIVTGSSRGIGREIAMALASIGVKVALVSVSAMHLFKTVSDLQKKGYDVIGIPTDTTKKESVKVMAGQVFEQFGKIDILVNCAGVSHLEQAVNFEEAMWEWVMEVNLKGTFLTCQTVGQYMIRRKRGRIINISSVFGLHGRSMDIAHAPSKAAMNELTRSLAVEWAKNNVNVNAVAPMLTKDDIAKGQASSSENMQELVHRIPKGHLCERRWIVGPVIFLCSPCSTFVTGHVLYVDGGYSIA